MQSKMRFVYFLSVIFIMLPADREVLGRKPIYSQLIGEMTPVWLVTPAGGVMLTDKNIIKRAVKQYKATNDKGKSIKNKSEFSLPDEKCETIRDRMLQYKNMKFSKNSTSPGIVELRKMKKKNLELIRNERSHNIVYPEILVIGDFKSRFTSVRSRKFLNYLIYLMKFWNSVNLRFRTLVKPKVQLRITGIVINTETVQIPFIFDNIDDVSRHILPRALEDMATWIEEINFIQDNEYDIAISMTQLPLCTYDARRRKCGRVVRTYGRSHFKMNCSHKGQAVAMFNDYYDYSGIHIATKLVAKLMGAPNDYETGYEHCFDEKRYIMSWRMDFGVKNFEWSPCSQNAIQNYFRSEISKCFRNSKPHRNQGNPVEEFLPGDKISIEAQCDDYGYGVACAAKNVCRNLECRMKAWFCQYVGAPALDGSSCNNGGVCRNGLCEK